MRRNFRVLQINGFRGLLIAFFAISCLIAGFIAFPAFLLMNAWNYLSVATSSFPAIDFAEGLLLWAIIIFSILIFNKRKFIVSFNSQQALTEAEMSEIVAKIRAQTHNFHNTHPKDSNIRYFNRHEEIDEIKKLEDAEDSQVEHSEK